MKLAAIDIGSNAMRLLIGDVYEYEGKVQISKSSLVRLPIRLGEDVFRNGKIGSLKYNDFLRGMEAFNTIKSIHKVEATRACATSAMRNAENGKQLAKEALKKTGINIVIIDGQKEAGIILSTFNLLNLNNDTPYLYIDVGGGSTEISLLINGNAVVSKSFKLGTVRILADKVKPKTFENLLDWIDEIKNKYHPKSAIGSGGNINRLVKICDSASEDEVYIDSLRSIYNSMKNYSAKERMVKWELRADRADVIVPAIKIYLNVIEHAGIDSIMVPKIGLADGLLYNMYLDCKLDDVEKKS